MKELNRFNSQVDSIVISSIILSVMMVVLIIMCATFGEGDGLFRGSIGWIQLFVVVGLGITPLAWGFWSARKVIAQHQTSILDLAKISVEQEERIRQLETQVAALSAWYSGPDQVPSRSNEFIPSSNHQGPR